MIRQAALKDLEKVLSIEEVCFAHDRLPMRSLKYMYNNKQAYFFVYVENKKIAGYIITLCHRRSFLARHYSLAVLPEYRKRGIAEKLLSHTEKLCKDKLGFKLEVRQDNHHAINLYKRLGYEIKGVKKSFYADGTDAFAMVKII